MCGRIIIVKKKRRIAVILKGARDSPEQPGTTQGLELAPGYILKLAKGLF
jgi:hypothetical protein